MRDLFSRLLGTPPGRGFVLDRHSYNVDVGREKVYGPPGLAGGRAVPDDPALESTQLRSRALERLNETMQRQD